MPLPLYFPDSSKLAMMHKTHSPLSNPTIHQHTSKNMATSTSPLTTTTLPNPTLPKFPTNPFLSFTSSLKPTFSKLQKPLTTLKAQTLDFSGSFYESGGFGSDEDPPSTNGSGISTIEDKETPPCPPGLRQYETMAVLRPDMSEDERLALTQKYEELLISGGGMYVEVFNRGVIPLAYSIRKKNKAGETNTYLDGIYLLFTYFTKPESMAPLEFALNTDDDVIRSSSFKVRRRKY